MDISTLIAIASFLMSIACLVWVGGFRMSALIHEVQHLGTRMDKEFERVDRRFEKIETRLDRIEGEFHKMDIRVTKLQHDKK